MMAEQLDLMSLLEIATDELRDSVSRPNVLAFEPYEGQRKVVESQAPGRYVSGGNRAGKTTIEVVDSIWKALGKHPYRTNKRPGPQRIRFVVVDIVKGIHQIILPEIRRWLPSSALLEGRWDKSWDERHLTLTLANRSTFQFLTHQMELDKHGGVKLDAVYFDEEPPQDIFNENLMRLIDYDGEWMVAATAVRGIGWMYDYLVEDALENPTTELEVFTLSQNDNPYLAGTRDTRNRFYVGMSKEDREIREDGAMIARQGLVFPQFAANIEKFVLDEHRNPSKDWEWYTSMDHGFNNPTAWLWHARSPDGRLYTFAEHYQRAWTVPEHIMAVTAIEALLGKKPDVRIGDPAIKQRNGITGTSVLTEYAAKGIYINVETVSNDVEDGISRLQDYFKIRSKGSPWGDNMPYWRISPNCPNLIRELKKLKWAAPESAMALGRKNVHEVVYKKDDHAFDSMRYLSTVLPMIGDKWADAPEMDEAGQPVLKKISFDEMLYMISRDPEAYRPTDDPWGREDYKDDTDQWMTGMLPL